MVVEDASIKRRKTGLLLLAVPLALHDEREQRIVVAMGAGEEPFAPSVPLGENRRFYVALLVNEHLVAFDRCVKQVFEIRPFDAQLLAVERAIAIASRCEHEIAQPV